MDTLLDGSVCRRRISGGFSATKEESGEDEQLEAMTG
jgi:hypothetical protein